MLNMRVESEVFEMVRSLDFTHEKEEKLRLCPVCSHRSTIGKWVDDKCPFCRQVFVPADEASYCPNCRALNKKKDIVDGRCPKCR